MSSVMGFVLKWGKKYGSDSARVRVGGCCFNRCCGDSRCIKDRPRDVAIDDQYKEAWKRLEEAKDGRT